jgi:hypothetical protein
MWAKFVLCEFACEFACECAVRVCVGVCLCVPQQKLWGSSEKMPVAPTGEHQSPKFDFSTSKQEITVLYSVAYYHLYSSTTYDANNCYKYYYIAVVVFHN